MPARKRSTTGAVISMVVASNFGVAEVEPKFSAARPRRPASAAGVAAGAAVSAGCSGFPFRASSAFFFAARLRAPPSWAWLAVGTERTNAAARAAAAKERIRIIMKSPKKTRELIGAGGAARGRTSQKAAPFPFPSLRSGSGSGQARELLRAAPICFPKSLRLQRPALPADACECIVQRPSNDQGLFLEQYAGAVRCERRRGVGVLAGEVRVGPDVPGVTAERRDYPSAGDALRRDEGLVDGSGLVVPRDAVGLPRDALRIYRPPERHAVAVRQPFRERHREARGGLRGQEVEAGRVVDVRAGEPDVVQEWAQESRVGDRLDVVVRHAGPIHQPVAVAHAVGVERRARRQMHAA